MKYWMEILLTREEMKLWGAFKRDITKLFSCIRRQEPTDSPSPEAEVPFSPHPSMKPTSSSKESIVSGVGDKPNQQKPFLSKHAAP